jgi:MFS family permease
LANLRERLGSALGGLSPVFWTLVAGMFVNRLASFVVTFLALYLVRERGFSAGEAGRVVALYGAGALVAGPLGGTLADLAGRRATMLLSLTTGAAMVAAIGFLRSPAWLALFTFLAAATNELYRPAMSAAIADVVPPGDRARAWGITYWAINLGWSFGLALGGLLAEVSFVALFLADAASSLVFAVIVARRVPETRPRGGEVHSPLAGLALVLRDGPFVVFLLLTLAALVVFVQFQLALPLDMDRHGLGPAVFGTLVSLNGVAIVLLQPLSAMFLRVRESARFLATSCLLVGLGYGVNALAGILPALPVYLGGVLLWTLGEIIGFPVAAAVVADLAPADLRGRYQGAFSMAWGVAFTLAPLLGGAVLSGLGGTALWLGCLALGAAVAAGHLAAAGPRRRRLALDAVRAAAEPPPAG